MGINRIALIAHTETAGALLEGLIRTTDAFTAAAGKGSELRRYLDDASGCLAGSINALRRAATVAAIDEEAAASRPVADKVRQLLEDFASLATTDGEVLAELDHIGVTLHRMRVEALQSLRTAVARAA